MRITPLRRRWKSLVPNDSRGRPMQAHPISWISELLILGLFHTLLSDSAPAQQRPGIKPFVNVPEGCYLSEPPNIESPFSFAKMQIQALWMARRGERANLDVLASGVNLPAGRMAEMIRGMREERIEDTCASFMLSAFTGSKNENAATVAKILSSAYQQLGNMSDQMLGIVLQDTVDRNRNSARDRLTEWKAKRRSIMDNMAQTLNLFLATLIDERRRDSPGYPDYLVLTRAQREELVSFLNSKFPALENEKKAGHAGDFVAQAIQIQSFLTGNYRSADSR